MNMILRDVKNQFNVTFTVGARILVDGVLCQITSIDMRTRQLTLTPMSADHCREYANNLTAPQGSESNPSGSVEELFELQQDLQNLEKKLFEREKGLQDWEKQLTERSDLLDAKIEPVTNQLSASEAVYGFGSWLTTLPDSLTVGARQDSSPVAELCSDFCNAHRLADTRDHWEKNLRPIITDVEQEGGPGNESTPGSSE